MSSDECYNFAMFAMLLPRKVGNYELIIGNLSNGALNRDAYGFAVRPQHLQTYREHANIYKV